MKCIITLLLVTTCTSAAYSQKKWHAATDTLKQPQSPTGFYPSAGYFNRYDTVPCTYLTATDDTQPKKGFKFVYVLNGFFTDDVHTFQVFFDDKLRKVSNVSRFYFEWLILFIISDPFATALLLVVESLLDWTPINSTRLLWTPSVLTLNIGAPDAPTFNEGAME